MKKFLYPLLICSIWVSCSSPKYPPTLILTNGKIWTGESADSFAEAIAITGNKITKVGDSESILDLAGSETEVVDLQGKLVTDGHLPGIQS
jgi:predicted amidohydrolase YtcJ